MARTDIEVTVEAPVRPTEDPEKVKQAVQQIFPDAEIHLDDGAITGHSRSIKMLLKKAGDERVFDAARGALWRGRQGNTATRFQVNKQAAYVGRLNFNEVTHPLGDITVKIQTDDLQALLDEIAPPTRAELAHAERTAARRAALHGEETHLARLGSRIDTGFEDEELGAPGLERDEEE